MLVVSDISEEQVGPLTSQTPDDEGPMFFQNVGTTPHSDPEQPHSHAYFLPLYHEHPLNRRLARRLGEEKNQFFPLGIEL